MKFDPDTHHRRTIRLQGYDYSRPGGYYITIVAQGRELLFGNVVNGEMILSKYGRIVVETLQWLQEQYPYVELAAWVVMPNHTHVIIILHEGGRGGSRSAPTGRAKIKSLGGLIGAFKTVSTKKINILRNTKGEVVWQRNYYEHVIRNDDDYNCIHHYIFDNPAMWDDDDENPAKTGK